MTTLAGRGARRTARAALVLVLVGVLVVRTAPAASADSRGGLPGDPLNGREVFFQKGCGRCHAIWGEGGGLGPDLGRGGVWHSLLGLAGVLWNHSPGMIEKMRERRIVRATISSAEMADLAAFLYYLDYFDPPGVPSLGEVVFQEKGCVRCHALGGSGGNVGPALDSYKRYASPLFLVNAMWRHGPTMVEKMRAMAIAPPRFAGSDLADLLAYIQKTSWDQTVGKTYMVPGSPARGEQVFVSAGCQKCHAVQGAGGSGGPDLGTRDLRRTVTEIAGRMWNHEPSMWAKARAIGIALPQFSDQELSDLIAYIFFLQYFDPPGNVERGRGVYLQKGCIVCHSAAPESGRPVAPDLVRSGVVASPLGLSAAMWNHAPVMEGQIRELGLPWPRFVENEIRDLVAYLRTKDAEARSSPAR